MKLFDTRKIEIEFTRTSYNNADEFTVVSDVYIIDKLYELRDKYEFTISSISLDIISSNHIVLKCNKEDCVAIALEFIKLLGNKVSDYKIRKKLF